VCRLLRRAADARRRRGEDLAAARADERARKKSSRTRLGLAGAEMSRAGLPPQLSQRVEEFMIEVGQADERSRAGLRRLLRKMLVAGLVVPRSLSCVLGPR
jgi:hypothetical protein